MKAIMIMFDTLSRRFLSTYGSTWVKTPNFERLKQHSAQFDNFYAGSLPCMPARRELQTGRYNFLHRGWGPIEPYDVCAMDLLKKNGIYAHICSDHSHYWEDGGATYLPRYSSWEGFRGQEGDRWVGMVNAKQRLNIPKQTSTTKMQESFYVNYANRTRATREEEFSSVKCVQAGIRFIDENIKEDNWFLQVECFDPHEPFHVPQRFLDLYEEISDDVYFDWPTNAKVSESKAEQRQVKIRYAALISMCDEYLGKILDKFDEYDLWKDTMLVVNTDHGFLMGEHDWWGKNIQPLYNEVVHLPFYLYDPRHPSTGGRESLTQTIDIAPTLLEFFGIEIPTTMLGHPLSSILKQDHEVREAALFGSFAGAINVCDAHHVYMRSCIDASNQPCYEYTLMPTKIRGFLPSNNLKKASLSDEFACFDHFNVLKIPSKSFMSPYRYGNKLFDLRQDPDQNMELDDLNCELEMMEKMRCVMIQNEAPKEQYERMGILQDRKMRLEELMEQKNVRSRADSLPFNFHLTKQERAQILMVRDMLDKTLWKTFYQRIEEEHTQHRLWDILEDVVEQHYKQQHLPMQYLSMFLNNLRSLDS